MARKALWLVFVAVALLISVVAQGSEDESVEESNSDIEMDADSDVDERYIGGKGSCTSPTVYQSTERKAKKRLETVYNENPPKMCNKHRSTKDKSFKFVVLGDIHISSDVAKKDSKRHYHEAAMKWVAKINPHFVMVAGDMTSGNCKDNLGVLANRAAYADLERSFKPIREAGIPVLPVVGNHDYLSTYAKEAYWRAYKDLASMSAPMVKLNEGGDPPFYYSFDQGDVHFQMLHIKSAGSYPKQMVKWMKEDMKKAEEANPNVKLRFAVGHVPFKSVMSGKSGMYKRLANDMHGVGTEAYFCAHEHLIHDDRKTIGSGKKLRQVIVGTTATYFYGINSDMEKTCPCTKRKKKGRKSICVETGTVCTMPATGRKFEVNDGKRRQPIWKEAIPKGSHNFVYKHGFTVVEVSSDGTYNVRPVTLTGTSSDKIGKLSDLYMDKDPNAAPLPGPDTTSVPEGVVDCSEYTEPVGASATYAALEAFRKTMSFLRPLTGDIKPGVLHPPTGNGFALDDSDASASASDEDVSENTSDNESPLAASESTEIPSGVSDADTSEDE